VADAPSAMRSNACTVQRFGGCYGSEMMTDSNELLRRYAADRSEPAFTELVQRHIDLVYSAALRQVNGDTSAAEDVTQTVFTDLARKATRLTRHPSLTGWLYTSTHYLAAKARRAELRRRVREQTACAMNQIHESPDPEPAWSELRPVLDDVMHELNATDREAVLLRLFEHRPLAEVGARLGLSEDAARLRVDRALDKLRTALAKRGVTSTAAALAAALSGQAVGAAPVGLALQVAHATLAAGGGLGASLANFLTLTKAKLIGVGAVGVVAIGLLMPAWLNHHGRAATATTDSVSPAPASAAPAASAESAKPLPAETVASSNKLVLHFVAADNGTPIPNVGMDYWLWGGPDDGHKQLQSTRFGICNVPVPRDTATQLILVSQVDGFAETRLAWRPDRGETIPAEYTLRLARAVPIGGKVVDADDQPVAGAQIGFGNQTDPAQETRPQSDNFSWPFWITTTTGADGTWHIDRIAKEVIRTITGAASHPEHVRMDVNVAGNLEVETQLLARSYVFHLGRAVTIQGVVVDPDGNPVPNATVLVGFMGEVNSRKTKSLANGTFSVAGCKPGKGPLNAEAQGFAPTMQEVEIGTNTGSFRLTLQRGKLARLIVVDKRGTPVPNATVSLNTAISGPTGLVPTAQIEFTRNTGADGRVQWDGAPDRELAFNAYAAGYMRSDDVTVRPDGQQHEIILSPALTISGTVRDAATGQPVPRFRIITGWPARDRMTGTTNATWSRIDRFWLSFEGGKFRHVFEEPVVSGIKDPTFVFKVEAEGYAPFITRVVLADEGEAQFDVRLRAASATTVTVLLPDGRPAANADIDLVSPGSRLILVPGGFSHQHASGSVLRTDASGHFLLPPDETIKRVIAAHPDGYVEATVAALTAEPVLRLQPWGRLEGTVLVKGQPAAGCELSLQYEQGDITTVLLDFQTFRVKANDSGHFLFPQVPPGKHKLVRVVETKTGEQTWWNLKPLQEVEIRPGETTTVTAEVPTPVTQ